MDEVTIKMPRETVDEARKKILKVITVLGELIEALESIDAYLQGVRSGEDWDDYSIKNLNLSTRSFLCLWKEGIRSVGQLIQQTEEDLIGIRNFGKRSLNEVKRILAEEGLSLASISV